MIRHTFRRVIGFAMWPPSRAIALGLAWTHREIVALWARSLAAELRRRPFDPKRVQTLMRTLWKVTTDPRLRGAGGIRSLSVDTDTYSEAAQTYRVAAIQSTLAEVPGVVSVEVDGAPLGEPQLVEPAA